jgi:hypothetical protein
LKCLPGLPDLRDTATDIRCDPFDRIEVVRYEVAIRDLDTELFLEEHHEFHGARGVDDPRVDERRLGIDRSIRIEQESVRKEVPDPFGIPWGGRFIYRYLCRMHSLDHFAPCDGESCRRDIKSRGAKPASWGTTLPFHHPLDAIDATTHRMATAVAGGARLTYSIASGKLC